VHQTFFKDKRWRKPDRYPEGFSGQSFFWFVFLATEKNEHGSQTRTRMVHVENYKAK